MAEETPEQPDIAQVQPLWKRLLPWLIAVVILGYLFSTIPFDKLTDAIRQVAMWKLVLLSAGFVAALLFADSLAMWVGFREAIPDKRLRLVDVMEMRGASYLLAIVNYGVGQGGIIYFLKRYHGVRLAVGAGAVLLTSGAFIIVIALIVGTGMLAGAVPNRPELKLVAVAVVAALPAYLAVIAIKPRFLAERAFCKPLFEPGVLGTLRVAAARGVHATALVLGHWLAMRVFGIDVPFHTALALIPVLLLVAAVPIAPSGLGTTQAAAVTLFAKYAPGGEEAVREATVLAYSLSFHFISVGFVALIGLICLRQINQRTVVPERDFDSTADSP